MELFKPGNILSVILICGLGLALTPGPTTGEPLVSGETEKEYLRKKIGLDVFFLTQEGERLQDEGDLDGARSKYREAHQKSLRGGVDLGVAWAGGYLGDLASQEGDHARGITWFS